MRFPSSSSPASPSTDRAGFTSWTPRAASSTEPERTAVRIRLLAGRVVDADSRLSRSISLVHGLLARIPLFDRLHEALRVRVRRGPKDHAPRVRGAEPTRRVGVESELRHGSASRV